MSEDIVVPILRGGMPRVNVTPRWFVNNSEYRPQAGQFELLINGEAAFGAVHRAIEQAKQSICIICWGFQPSMYLVRDGAAPCIGDLLVKKAEEGVVVRVLSWELRIDPLTMGSPLSVVLPSVKPVNPTGQALGEPNTPGRWDLRLPADRPATSNDEQYEYDVSWFDLYDDEQEPKDNQRKERRAGKGDSKAANLHFRGRGFSHNTRLSIGTDEFADGQLSAKTRAALAAFPSHHQKMVVVDHDSPEDHVGFLMGHNLLDNYWDTNKHSAQRHFILTGQPDPHPNRHANGKVPFEDFSSRLTGPIVGDLFANFAQAWEKDSGESLPRPAFQRYPARIHGASQPITGQILRTQPEYGRKDVKTLYLQAVNNATQYIYIENQYFRWPELGEQIRLAAERQLAAGRTPEEHGSLHLFVITNSSDDGIGAGIDNTQRMLETLGRADVLPAVTKDVRTEALDAQIEEVEKRIKRIEAERAAADNEARLLAGLPNTGAILNQKYAPINARLESAQAELEALEAARAKNDSVDIDKDAEAFAEERPGLKCHICTLVAPDTQKGQKWVEVYIHAKLMLIDDTFMTLGSSNINTRSMEVDSELNLAHDRPEITRVARSRLWDLHTKGAGNQENIGEAFRAWGELMTNNTALRGMDEEPIASLAAFLRASPERSNVD